METQRQVLLKILFVALGGAFGSVLRYELGRWIQDKTTSSFPTGTIVINVTGCFAIGFLGMLFTGPMVIREEYRVGILVGILGGYTTFSTFGRETFMLANENQGFYAVMNLLLSNTFGVIAVWLGHRLAERWYGV
jgi:CrcB protein